MEKTRPSQATQHKFDQPMRCPLTHRERVELEYTAHFIPFLKILEKSIGREKVIESLQELACQEAKAIAESDVKARGKNDLSFFKDIYSPRILKTRAYLTFSPWR